MFGGTVWKNSSKFWEEILPPGQNPPVSTNTVSDKKKNFFKSLQIETLTTNKEHAPSKKSVGEEMWNLPTIFIAPLAADWYILKLIKLQKGSYALFDEYTHKTASIIASYIDMAVGGEIRHCNDSMVGKAPSWVKLLENIDRPTSWERWKIFREHMPHSLEQAEDLFKNRQWNGAMGGKKWGQAARLLQMYSKKELSEEEFIDQAFCLEHNTGSLFSKHFQDCHKLKTVLDTVQKITGLDDNISIAFLISTATDEVKKEVKKIC